jgi:hypothetical protein
LAGREFALEGAVVGGRGTLVAYGDAGSGGAQKLDAALDALTRPAVSSVFLDLSATTGMDIGVLGVITRHMANRSSVCVLLPASGLGLDFPLDDGAGAASGVAG